MLRKIYYFISIFLNSLLVCNCGNVLIISATPMYSHNIAFLEVWKELHNRGHNITFVTTFPEKNEVNFTHIDISSAHRLLEAKYSKISAASKWFLWNLCWELTVQGQEEYLSLPVMQDIIQNPNKYKFDVIITEIWFTNTLALSKIYNCPSIAFATIDVYEVIHWHLGNSLNHVTNPELNVGLFEATNFYERIESALFTLHEIFKEYLIYLPQQQANLDRFFGGYINVTAVQLKQDIDLLMINANPFLKGVRAVGPTTIMVGGGNHLNPPKPLPQELKLYLDNAENGFIYLSLGSLVKSTDLDNDSLMVLVDVFDKLPYQILWKYEADEFPTKRKNLKTIKWAPQQDILRHPNIKLFISQGGIQSLEETIFSHVPVLVLPFAGDQHKNGHLVQRKGFGKMIQHKPRLDKTELEDVIKELILNPIYKDTAKKYAKLMNDTYMTGLEKSIWWIEYVIRNKGTKELRNPAVKLPLYQYYALDVLGLLLLTGICIRFLIFLFIKSISILFNKVIITLKITEKKKMQ